MKSEVVMSMIHAMLGNAEENGVIDLAEFLLLISSATASLIATNYAHYDVPREAAEGMAEALKQSILNGYDEEKMRRQCTNPN